MRSPRFPLDALLPLQKRTPARLRPRSCRPVPIETLEKRLLLASVPSGFTDQQLAANLSSPTAIAVAPDGRVFFTEQNGTIRILKNDTLLSAPFATLSGVDSYSERGLLGITLDPNFSSNHYVYVYYTAASPSPHNRLVRLTASGDGMVPGSELTLFDLPTASSQMRWHQGGGVHFGGDGKLYVGVGDHEVGSFSQDMTVPFGKMLRVNPDGSIPTDNPFYNSTTGINKAIWALGLRNPYTFNVQPGTGRLFINDVGQGSWEEIDEGTAGANYGWPNTEGYTTNPAYKSPFYAYPHGAECAITGGAFYNPANNQFPSQYVGQYFFADFCAGWIKTINPSTAAVSSFATGASYPTDMAVAPDGSLYYLSRGIGTGTPGAGTGSVWKISYPANSAPFISVQPADQRVAVGQPATFSVVASGAQPLSYQWQRNGVNISGATSASYTLASTTTADNGALFRVRVSNSSGSVLSNSATLTVINGQAPVGSILSPAAGTTYQAGNTINYSGTATDNEDGSLPASAFTWQVDFHHADHIHPFVPPTTGSKTGSFTIPTTGETAANVFYRITLSVQDSTGLTHTTSRDILPQTSTFTLATSPAGLPLKLDDQPQTTPTSVLAIVNATRTIEAPLVQVINGTTYEFVSWSDGGAARHDISVPATNTTYTATYRLASSKYVSDLPFATTPINGYGPVERDTSNGESYAGDGKTITLNGATYPKGLGVHAASEVTFNLSGQYARFFSDIGVDDEVAAGSVVFQVFADGVKIYDSGLMTGTSATKSVDVSVAGKNQLKLIVTNAGDGQSYDHADWANARLTSDGGTTPTLPAAPSNLAASAVSSSQINLSWTDNASNESGFKIERSADGTSFAQIATVGAGVTTYSNTGLAASTQYFYRVRAYNSAGDSTYSNTANATTQPGTSTGTTYVSDLAWASASNGYGPVEKDKSNGEAAGGDGKTITLNGVTYAKGLGVHANSDILFNLNGQYSSFVSDVGVDDEVGSVGSVVFQLFADGTKIFDSGTMTGASATQSVNVSVAGVNQLRLVVTDAANGNAYDHADWANARLTSDGGTIPTLPAAPSGLAASAGSSSQINLSWTDNASNESGFKIERSADGTSFAQIATVGAGVTTYSNTGLAASTQYFYRVRAYNSAGDSNYSNTANATTQSSGSTTLPSPWTSSDIGNTGQAGSASFSNGTYTVKGAGGDIWGTSDAFHFAYQTLSGNGQIVARVTGVQNTHSWAKAGVMIRESLAANSKHAMMVLSPNNGLAFQYRTNTAGSTANTSGGAATAPYWLKLVRNGTTLTAYKSPDGNTWTLVGSATISMANTIYIGLAVTAHSTKALNTSTFDNVSVTPL